MWLRCFWRKSGTAPGLVEEVGRTSIADVERCDGGEEIQSWTRESCKIVMHRGGDGPAALVVEVPR